MLNSFDLSRHISHQMFKMSFTGIKARMKTSNHGLRHTFKVLGLSWNVSRPSELRCWSVSVFNWSWMQWGI